MESPDGRVDSRVDDKVSAVIVYRLEQAESKLQKLDDKLVALSEGFVGVKIELEHVAKNEGKTSGAISGVISGVIIAVLGVLAQMAFNVG